MVVQWLFLLLSLDVCAAARSSAPMPTADSDTSLFGRLQRVAFRNAGMTWRWHRYAWQTVPVASGSMFYLEQENVSCTQCSWGGNTGTHRFVVPSPPPPAAPVQAPCVALNSMLGMDIPGHDLKTVQAGVVTRDDCLRSCCATPGCDGLVFLPKTAGSKNGACIDPDRPCCFLKTGSVRAPRIHSALPGIAAEIVNGSNSSQGRGATGSVPPSGIRSAVPLGGISAGSVELRGDGSFSEFTLQNQSPAGAAKIAVMPDALLAMRLCGGTSEDRGGSRSCVSRLLQTHPRGDAADVESVPPIEGLNYSGTFPVSRLVPVDTAFSNTRAPGLSTALFAYSSLAAGDMHASSRPAIAFTLAMHNNGPYEINASLLLNMPLQVETDQARPGVAMGSAINTTDAQACAEACQLNKACMSWNYVRALGSCQLQSSWGLNRYTLGSDAGVRGEWSVDSDGRCVTLTRPGDAPTSGSVSLCCADSSGSVTAHSRLGSVLHTFGATGRLSSGGVGVGSQGTAVIGTTVPPGANRTVSLTLGWRFPLRDWYNYDCNGNPGWSVSTCGGRYDSHSRKEMQPLEAKEKQEGNASFAYVNKYSEIYPTAREAAWAPRSNGTSIVDTEAQLAETLHNISAVHSVFMRDSSLPDWLQDHLVNSISHVRDAYWFSNASCPQCTRSADPRTASDPVLWRQFEAFDCTDLDSIHNDGERHMPYITLWPHAERSKLAAWAVNQAPRGWAEEGMLAEQIHQNTPDTPDGWTANDTGSGRHMGDSSSAFVLEVLELYRWANDTTTLELYWQTVKQVVHWQLKQSEVYGVPFKLETSYDILGFPAYELAAYNSVFHIATLAAAAELGDAMGEPDFAARCRSSQSTATKAFDTLQWNSTKRAYDAGSDGCTAGVGCDSGIGVSTPIE